MTGNPFDNQEFRKELGEVLDAKLEPFTKLISIVDAHEAAINRGKGARAAVITLWTVIVAVSEWFFHRK